VFILNPSQINIGLVQYIIYNNYKQYRAVAAEAAESAIGNVLDDVGVDVLPNHEDEDEDTNDVEMAQAAGKSALVLFYHMNICV
jgi:hypothetical protein